MADQGRPIEAAKPITVELLARLTNDAYADRAGGRDPSGGPREEANATYRDQVEGARNGKPPLPGLPAQVPSVVDEMKAAGFRPLRDIPAGRQSATGFFARVWVNDTTQPPTLIVANRGTDGGLLQDFRADAQFVLGPKTGLHPQYKEALDAIADLKRDYPDARLVTTGHSLGGGLAELQKKVFHPSVAAAYSFDAPGARELSQSDAFKAIAKTHNPAYPQMGSEANVTNWVVNGTHVGDTKITGPHIGGTQRRHIHTDEVVGASLGLKNTAAVGANAILNSPTTIGPAIAATVAISTLEHEFTRKHPASSIVAALRSVDRDLGQQAVPELSGLSRPQSIAREADPRETVLETAQAKAVKRAEANYERATDRVEAAKANLHRVLDDGLRKTEQSIADQNRASDFNMAVSEGTLRNRLYVFDTLGMKNQVGLAGQVQIDGAKIGETIGGTVVKGVGPQGYAMLQTGEREFKYVPLSAFPAGQQPKEGDQLRITVDPKTLQARADATPEPKPIEQGERVKGTVVPSTARPDLVVVQTGPNDYTSIPRDTFPKGKVPQPPAEVSVGLLPSGHATVVTLKEPAKEVDRTR